MNEKAAKACRAWLAATGYTPRAQAKAYAEAKRQWRALSHRERGQLREQWSEAAAVRRYRGQAKSAIVRPDQLAL